LTASEARSGRRGGVTAGVGRRGREDKTDKWAPVLAVVREKAPRTEGVNQRRKGISANTPTTRVGRAAWAGQLASACGRRGASGAGWTES
jgi:hypothetical protein